MTPPRLNPIILNPGSPEQLEHVRWLASAAYRHGLKRWRPPVIVERECHLEDRP